MSKYKIEPDEKIRTVEGILNGKETQRHAAARLGESALSFYDEFYKYLTDQLLLDWTGDLDVQPQMYFLPIELTKEFTNENSRKPELDELYKLGLLQQFSSEGSVNFINYFVPLEIPDTDIILKKIKTLRTRKLWHQIVLGINSEIRRLVSNNKN